MIDKNISFLPVNISVLTISDSRTTNDDDATPTTNDDDAKTAASSVRLYFAQMLIQNLVVPLHRVDFVCLI